MKLRVSAILLLAATTGAFTFAALPAREAPAAKSAQELARALEGRTAGRPVTCIPNFRGQARMQVLDDQTIIFRDGATVYLQRPRSQCNGLDNGGYALVTKLHGSQQICAGDIHQLIDLTTGVYGGSCVFSDFVPYRKAI
jgi:hypothetical protein